MGKTLDALLGRSFKPSKFKALMNLAISRLAVLKNQRQTRCSISRSDVVQLLNLGEHERALIRVEQVMKEWNMLDVFGMIEGYCILLGERVKLTEQEKACPDELKEAISSLIFAASRCGDFPELQEIRSVFTTRYGKEFSHRAIELRNNCGVNHKMIQKLSTRQPSLESRMTALKEIADENRIRLQLEKAPPMAEEDNENEGKENQCEVLQNQFSGLHDYKKLVEEMDKVEGFSDTIHTRKKYKHAAEAAQEAFLSATYAAAAARAAVELSGFSPQGPDDTNDPNNHRKQEVDSNHNIRLRGDSSGGKNSEEAGDQVLGFDKVHPADKYNLNSKTEEESIENESPETIYVKQADLRRDFRKDKQYPKEVRFEENEYGTDGEKFTPVSIKDQWGNPGQEPFLYSSKQNPWRFQSGSIADYKVHSSAGPTVEGALRLNIEKKLMSVRTRR